MTGPELNRHEWFLIEEALNFYWNKKMNTCISLKCKSGNLKDETKGRGKKYAEAKLKADQVKPLHLKISNHFE